jgi:hypothetical protein
MRHDLQPGDFLVFQLEAGYAMVRLLAVEEAGDEITWHVSAYADLFPDIDSAEQASASPQGLTLSLRHVALTNRAFESTQVARISNFPLTPPEFEPFRAWTSSPERNVSDRSIRLLLGLR